MNCSEERDDLVKKLESYLEKVNALPIHPLSKLKIINQYVYSKIRWPLSIYPVGETWLKQNCDNMISRQVRHWLNLHPGANISHLKCSISKLGLNFRFPSDVYACSQMTVRKIMQASNDEDIRKVYEATKEKHISSHEIIARSIVKKTPAKKLQTELIQESSWSKFLNLKKENLIIKYITEYIGINRIKSWQKVAGGL